MTPLSFQTRRQRSSQVARRRLPRPLRLPVRRRILTAVEGAQLLEFALALPFLLVIVIGIIDFGGAFNLKQKMTNAAREGARMAISNTLSDTSCSSSTPCSIQAAAKAVANYMTSDGVNSSCINPSSPSSTGTQLWTFTCPSGISLTIDRGYTFTPAGGFPIQATKVTLTYPYTWTFSHIVGLLVRGAQANLPSTLTSTAVMQNLVAN
jgi:Flp pilus assembly protein TadG